MLTKSSCDNHSLVGVRYLMLVPPAACLLRSLDYDHYDNDPHLCFSAIVECREEKFVSSRCCLLERAAHALGLYFELEGSNPGTCLWRQRSLLLLAEGRPYCHRKGDLQSASGGHSARRAFSRAIRNIQAFTRQRDTNEQEVAATSTIQSLLRTRD
jgi:hypothetical protein